MQDTYFKCREVKSKILERDLTGTTEHRRARVAN
jgi:hypothetical protein